MPGNKFICDRLFDLAGRIKDVDPQLTRVLVPWVVEHPRYIPGFVRLARTIGQSHRVRVRLRAEGLCVPPFLVLSVTSQCNLRCSGCYAGAVGTVTNKPARPGLDFDAWERVVKEAIDLGVMAFLIAGGEPFLVPGVSQLFHRHPDRLFLVFTNGTAIHDSDFETLKSCSNTVVVVSIEGDRELTDLRRGRGVFEKATRSLDRLAQAGVLTGIAVTVSPANIEYWTLPENIDVLIARSGPLAMFIEEIPAAGCENPVQATAGQRARFRASVVEYRDRMTGGAFIIHSPGDEEVLGGCVSAGVGFAHVTPYGDLTACPVSALATHNLRSSTLRESLASPLFSMIRENRHLLETAGHPCGLSAHAAELADMGKMLGAYCTDPRQTDTRGDWPVTIH